MLCSDICVCENNVKLSLKMHFPYGTLLFQIGVYVLEGICRTPGVPFIRRLTNQAREQKKQLPTVAGNGMANLVKVLVHQVKEVNEVNPVVQADGQSCICLFRSSSWQAHNSPRSIRQTITAITDKSMHCLLVDHCRPDCITFPKDYCPTMSGSTLGHQQAFANSSCPLSAIPHVFLFCGPG